MELICLKRHEYPKRQEYVQRIDPGIGGWTTINSTGVAGYGDNDINCLDGDEITVRKPLLNMYNSSNFRGKIYIKEISIVYERNGGNISLDIKKVDSSGAATSVLSKDETDLFTGLSGTATYSTQIDVEDLNDYVYFIEITIHAAAAPAAGAAISACSITYLVKNEENLSAIA